MKNFPISVLKILPAAVVLGVLSGCHASTSVEASTARVPVVAPAGTVLRVRLDQPLDSKRSRPGDRFSGVLDSAVMAGTVEILPKGTMVEGHVLTARESGKDGEEALLIVTLDSYQRGGRQYALATSAVARAAHPGPANKGKRISMPADSVMGFTLKSALAA